MLLKFDSVFFHWDLVQLTNQKSIALMSMKLKAFSCFQFVPGRQCLDSSKSDANLKRKIFQKQNKKVSNNNKTLFVLTSDRIISALLSSTYAKYQCC